MPIIASKFAEVLQRLAEERKPFAVATVVKTEGSSLGKPGFKMVIDGKGEITYGTLGGVCPEGPIIAVALEVMKTGTPKLVRVYLESAEQSVMEMVKHQSLDEIHVETFCGGVMEIFVEPFLPQNRLVIIAQGGKDDVEEALIKFAKILGFEVWSLNPLPMLKEQPDKLITDYRDEDFSFLNLSERDYVVILTKGERDIKILEALSREKPRFIGLLASRKRVTYDFNRLREKGVSEDFLKRVSAPVGADVGAVTPEEIALSIMAEIVATVRGRSVRRKDEEVVVGEVKAFEEGGDNVVDIGAGSCSPYTSRTDSPA
ncbi:MAG TPA: XdhC family protein [Candidatus Caldiarchaeum subterraneum]|uniref:XdhC family protein n=1 Tax=Caldiarchaeum subterraneum TaxID=311458 RepID=A0A832ZYV1_CALS0|nr:XdhC family protein [Candidatus Caldarchaeum subterraneum]